MPLEGNRFETIGDFKWCLECGGEVQFFWKGQRYGAVQYSFDNRRLYSIPFNQHSFSTDRKPAAKTANPSFPYPLLFAFLRFSLFSLLPNHRFRCCIYRIPALQDRNKSDGLRWSASAQHISAFNRLDFSNSILRLRALVDSLENPAFALGKRGILLYRLFSTVFLSQVLNEHTDGSNVPLRQSGYVYR